MELRGTVQRVNSLVETASSRFGFIAPLATRIVIGLAFFQAGLGKWRHMENAIGFFDSLGALLRTGPTNTNVCDIKIVLVASG